MKALITGVTGQDGSYLAEFLLGKGYEIYGLVRRTSSLNRDRIEHLKSNPKFHRIYGDLGDSSSINKAILEIAPDEVYNLAAQSQVRISFDQPEYTADINATGVVRLLEAILSAKKSLGKNMKFYQASTSELFGNTTQAPQNEKTPFHPESPYASSKLHAYWSTVDYREGHGIFACNGILFNHESPRRGENFVTRKITIGTANIKLGSKEVIELGNLDAKRDWGHARDYVEAMWLIMQQDKPDDYVIATGENHSVREFLERAFRTAGIEIVSNGKKGIEEEYIRKDTGETVVTINPRFFRPVEVNSLRGDYSKARQVLGWRPKTTFNTLVDEMVKSDIEMLTRGKRL